MRGVFFSAAGAEVGVDGAAVKLARLAGRGGAPEAVPVRCRPRPSAGEAEGAGEAAAGAGATAVGVTVTLGVGAGWGAGWAIYMGRREHQATIHKQKTDMGIRSQPHSHVSRHCRHGRTQSLLHKI